MKKIISTFMAFVMLLSVTSIAGVAFAEETTTSKYITSGEYEYEELGNNCIAITDYTGSATTVAVPDTIDGKTVTKISGKGSDFDYDYYGAFENKDTIISITLPQTVTSIGDWAFSSCDILQNVNIPSSVTEIGADAFRYCKSLQSIVIPEGVVVINNYTFAYCPSLKSVTLPSTLVSIGYRAFDGCAKLTKINIPDSVITMGESAFANCISLKTVTIPDTITNMEDYCFYNCLNLRKLIVDGEEYTCAKTSISSIKSSKKKQLKVAYKRAKSVKGYNVEYTTDKNFIKGVTREVITKNSAKKPSYTAKKLKSGRKYYVRVRTYDKVLVNGKYIYIYGAWSKTKAVKVK